MLTNSYVLSTKVNETLIFKHINLKSEITILNRVCKRINNMFFNKISSFCFWFKYIEIFNNLRKKCNQYEWEISEILEEDSTLSERLAYVFQLWWSESKWKGKPENLLTRLRKMWKWKTFSFRDSKLLSKVARKHKTGGKVDFKALEYYFPGKSACDIEDQLNKLDTFY